VRGVHAVKDAIAELLVAELATYVTAVATREDGERRVPRAITRDRLIAPAIEQYPAIDVGDLGVRGMRRVDTILGDPVYERTYGIRLIVWERTDRQGDAAGAVLRRDRLELALIECLLDHQDLGAGGRLLLMEESFVGDYSDPFSAGGGIGAGAHVDFDVTQVEQITRAPLAVPPLTITVDPVPVPWEE
jgi:hypothetical protein